MAKVRKWIFGYCVVFAVVLQISWWASRAVTVFVENAPIQRQYTIVIDPGHGGVDGGAISCTGIPESKLNLEICLILDDLFHFIGYRTRMIRTDDSSVYREGETISQKKISDLKERVRIVNETEDALLLSIHQNTFSDRKYAGGQVFYASTERSKSLAKSIQGGIVSTLNPGSNRKEKKSSGVFIMDNVTCPAVLIECGFLSNPAEEAKLRTSEYQQKLCCVIAATVAQYVSNT